MTARRALAGLVLVGFALRACALSWGLVPGLWVSAYHPDEAKFLDSVLRFPQAYLTSRSYIYGTACQYAVGLLLLPLKAAWVWGGAWPGATGFAAAVALASRLFSAAAGAASIYLVFELGELVFDEATGLAAAALTAFSFYHCVNGGFATLDVPMSALRLLALLACLRADRTRAVRDWALAGVACGALLGCKIVGATFLAVPAFLLASDAGLAPADRVKRLALCFGLAGAVFAATTPHAALRPAEYLRFMLAQKRAYVDAADGGWGKLAAAWAGATATAVGFPVAMLAAAGLFASRARRRRDAAALVLAIAGVYVFFRSDLAPRLVIEVAPLLCLLAARAAVSLWRTGEAGRALGGAVFAAALAHSVWLCAAGRWMRLDDPRDRATAYLARTCPPGTRVGLGVLSMADFSLERWPYPWVDLQRFGVSTFLSLPDVIVLSSTDYEPAERALRGEKVEWYKGVPPPPRVLSLYGELLGGRTPYRLVADFKPRLLAPIEFPPPEIRIYRFSRP